MSAVQNERRQRQRAGAEPEGKSFRTHVRSQRQTPYPLTSIHPGRDSSPFGKGHSEIFAVWARALGLRTSRSYSQPNMPDLFHLLLWLAALGCVVVGAGSLAIMTFVTDRFTRLERSEAAKRMQSLVSMGERSIFAVALYVAAACCTVVFLFTAPLWIDLMQTDQRDWGVFWAFFGSAGYLFGAFVWLVLVMPHLQAHIRVAGHETQEAMLWPLFIKVWRLYFLMPTIAGFGATVAFVAALNVS